MKYDPQALLDPKVSQHVITQMRRLEYLQRVLARANRVFVGRGDTRVHLADQPKGPAAWSDGVDVYVNVAQLNDIDIDSLINVHGLDFHEVCHLLFTPRLNESPTNGVVNWKDDKFKGRMMDSYNILEDQRIETIFTQMYPSTIPYLTSVVARWIISGGEDATEEDLQKAAERSYILVRGRRYLPVALRRTLRESFEHQELLPDVNRIIDEYRTLAFPCRTHDEEEHALSLVEEFAHLLEIIIPPEDGDGDGDGEDGTGSPCSSGTQQRGVSPRNTRSRQDRLQKKVARQEGGGDGQDGDDEPGQSAGDDLKDAIAKALEEAKDETRSEMRQKQDSIKAGKGAAFQRSNQKNPYHAQTRKADPHIVNVEKKFQDVLRLLADECAEGWDRATPSGRLNVGRVIQGCELDEAFDRWDTGSDGQDLEVVVCVDVSGSMGDYYGDAKWSAATDFSWVIDKAVKSIQADCTTYAFEDSCYVMYSKQSVPTDTQQVATPRGSTDPIDCLLDAEAQFAATLRKNKLLIMLTDGAWDGNTIRGCEASLRRMEAMGVTTAIAYIDSNADASDVQSYRHGVQVFSHVRNSGELLHWGKAVIKQVIKQRDKR